MIKIEWQAWNEFDTDLDCAIAALENITEAMHAPCGNTEYERQVYGAIRHLENAKAWIEGGLVRGEENNQECDD